MVPKEGSECFPDRRGFGTILFDMVPKGKKAESYEKTGFGIILFIYFYIIISIANFYVVWYNNYRF